MDIMGFLYITQVHNVAMAATNESTFFVCDK